MNIKQIKNHNKVNVLHHNIIILYKHFDEFEFYLKTMDVEYDAILLSEIWT